MGLIRLLLALSVVLGHSSAIFGFSLVGGRLAVELFYIISGFYMALILNEKYSSGPGSYKLFIGNRFLRLFPVYWVVLLLTVLGSVAVYLYSGAPEHGRLQMYFDYFSQMNIGTFLFLILTNVFVFFQDAIMFLGLNTQTGGLFFTSNFHATTPNLYNFLFIPQAWTLGLELLFYLIAPFIVRKSLRFILLLISASILLRILLMQGFGFIHDPWSYRFFPTELAFFLLGSVAYHVYNKISKANLNSIYSKLSFFLTLAFIIFFNFINSSFKDFLLIGIFFIALPFIFHYTKKWKVSNYAGELSYPVYISHNLILMFLLAFKISPLGGLGITLSLLTIIFSIFLNEVISKKIERLRQGRVLNFASQINHETVKLYGTNN